MSSSLIALEDKYFEVKSIDEHGKKFDKVSRLVCDNDEDSMELVIDINTDIFPVDFGDKLTVSLATSLELKPSKPVNDKKKDFYDQQLGTDEKPSLMDQYDYVMYGRVYKYQPQENFGKVSIYVSFGGLLMKLTGEARDIQHIEPDTHLYLLVRKS